MCRKNQKLAGCQKSSEAVSNVAQAKPVLSVKTVPTVFTAVDIQGAAAIPDVSEYLNFDSGRTDLGSTEEMSKRNNGLESEEPQTDVTGVSVSGVKSLPLSQTDGTNAASSNTDCSSSDAAPSEDNAAERIERLRGMIDRAAGQLYTIAEVYLMMMKPARVPLEYDWVDTTSSTVATDDVSGRLRKLVSVAKAAFTATTARAPPVSLNTDDSNSSSYNA